MPSRVLARRAGEDVVGVDRVRLVTPQDRARRRRGARTRASRRTPVDAERASGRHGASALISDSADRRARVEHREGDVDEGVHEEHADAVHEHRALHERVVLDDDRAGRSCCPARARRRRSRRAPCWRSARRAAGRRASASRSRRSAARGEGRCAAPAGAWLAPCGRSRSRARPSISTRTMRARMAAGPTASASTGRTYDSGPSRPATGQPAEVRRRRRQTSATPSRKSGMVPRTTLLPVKPSSAAPAPAAARGHGHDHARAGWRRATADDEGQDREGRGGRQPLGDDVGDRQPGSGSTCRGRP